MSRAPEHGAVDDVVGTFIFKGAGVGNEVNLVLGGGEKVNLFCGGDGSKVDKDRRR